MTEYRATKYDSAAAEIIAMLADEAEGYGRREDTTGEADAPTGYVALVTIPADVDLFAEGPIWHYVPDLAREYGVTAEDVVGVHIVTHNSQGFVDVTTYATEAEAREAFAEIERAYADYLGPVCEVCDNEATGETVDGVAYCDRHEPVYGGGQETPGVDF